VTKEFIDRIEEQVSMQYLEEQKEINDMVDGQEKSKKLNQMLTNKINSKKNKQNLREKLNLTNSRDIDVEVLQKIEEQKNLDREARMELQKKR
jgi:hypothetical protein